MSVSGVVWRKSKRQGDARSKFEQSKSQYGQENNKQGWMKHGVGWDKN